MSWRLDLARIIGYAFILAVNVILLFFLFWVGIVGPIAGLPNNPAILSEVSKITVLLLTVEGILLGLSPVIFDRARTRFLGAVVLTFTAYAFIWSLITIVLADTLARFDAVYVDYEISLGLFGGVVILYIAWAWDIVLWPQRSQATPEPRRTVAITPGVAFRRPASR